MPFTIQEIAGSSERPKPLTLRELFGERYEVEPFSVREVARHLPGRHDQRDHAAKSSYKSEGGPEDQKRLTATLHAAANDPQMHAAARADRQHGDVRNDPKVFDKATGRYTPAAERVNNRIAKSFIDEAPNSVALPGTQPIVVISMGKPGSGKTTVLNKIEAGTTDNVLPRGRVVVNADEVKARLPGFKGQYANSFHERSADIAESNLTRMVIAGRHNATLDMTGANMAKTSSLIDTFKANGYKVAIVHSDTSTGRSVERAYNRWKKGEQRGLAEGKGPGQGRLVAPTFIARKFGGNGISNNFASLKPKADAWYHYDNNGSTPTIKGIGGPMLRQ